MIKTAPGAVQNDQETGGNARHCWDSEQAGRRESGGTDGQRACCGKATAEGPRGGKSVRTPQKIEFTPSGGRSSHPVHTLSSHPLPRLERASVRHFTPNRPNSRMRCNGGGRGSGQLGRRCGKATVEGLQGDNRAAALLRACPHRQPALCLWLQPLKGRP